jgi:hypothetical protein
MTTVTTVAHFLNLEFDHWVVSWVHVLGLTSLTKIEIWACTTLETNACDGGLLAAIASDSMVHNGRVDRLSEFEKGMFCRMHRCGFTFCAKVEIGTDSTVVSSSHNREHIAPVTSHVAMGDTLGALLARFLARRFTLKPKVEGATREVP